jgi:hypothetical protein
MAPEHDSDEQGFRALLDDDGILRPGALAAPPRAGAFTVFAQRPDARLDVAELQRHAARFFATRLGLTVDKRYGVEAPPRVDAARIVVATAAEASSGTRLVFGRPATDDDHAAAQAAERAQQTTGMAELARRCATVWLVRAADAADGDPVALAVAAVLAGVFLGPILPPGGDALFGVKTARLRLESAR